MSCQSLELSVKFYYLCFPKKGKYPDRFLLLKCKFKQKAEISYL